MAEPTSTPSADARAPRRNLIRRIVTAIALLIPLIAGLYLLPAIALIPIFGLVVFLGAVEWAALNGFGRRGQQAYAWSATFIGAIGAWAVLARPAIIWPVLAAAALWWLWAFLELGRDHGLYRSRSAKALGGFLALIPLWLAAVFLHALDPRSPAVLLYVLVLVWLADSAAYLTGSTLGRTKLAPRISPGKTVEGVLGALVAVVLLAYFCGTMLWRFETGQLGLWIGLSVVVALVSVLGDLTESKLKRVAGVKDSGTLLPGHGGVLDRIDALMSAVPAFTLGWLLLLRLST